MSQDSSESASVVSRLAKLAATLKTIIVTFGVIMFGILFIIAAMVIDRGYWWWGAIIGVLVGYSFGIYVASMLSLFVDWMVLMVKNRS